MSESQTLTSGIITAGEFVPFICDFVKRSILKKRLTKITNVMNHEELKSMMMGASMQPFITSLFKELSINRGGTMYKSFEEVSMRKPLKGMQNGTYRADIVTFISTGYEDRWPKYYNRTNISVVFEVKSSISDFNKDKKFVNYFSCSDFFFFAVPTALCAQALFKMRDIPEAGIVDAERGNIVKMPHPQVVNQKYYFELLEQLIYCQRSNSRRKTAE